jgi:hypothetical protein
MPPYQIKKAASLLSLSSLNKLLMAKGAHDIGHAAHRVSNVQRPDRSSTTSVRPQYFPGWRKQASRAKRASAAAD